MIKYAEQTRLAIFLFITILTCWSYQMFFNASIDSEIDSAMEQQNKNVRRYMQMLEQAREQKRELQQEIIHLKAMYESSKANGEMLEQQIDVVSQHWLKKYIEVSDELFDIKNTKK